MSKLDDAIARGKDAGKLALYFGCWDHPGHHLHEANGRTIYDRRMAELEFPWADIHLDCGLLRNGKRADVCDGRVFWTCGGLTLWYAFFWWDRSGDKRTASNSGIYVRGFGWSEADDAFAFGCSQFPHVIARQLHPLALQPK